MRKRPKIVSVEDRVEADRAQVTVTLEWKERPWHGRAEGASDEGSRLAGEATLEAVALLVEDAVDLELLSVRTTEVDGATIALALVQIEGAKASVGSALVRDGDPRLAVVRAVMDAINRRLEQIL